MLLKHPADGPVSQLIRESTIKKTAYVPVIHKRETDIMILLWIKRMTKATSPSRVKNLNAQLLGDLNELDILGLEQNCAVWLTTRWPITSLLHTRFPNANNSFNSATP